MYNTVRLMLKTLSYFFSVSFKCGLKDVMIYAKRPLVRTQINYRTHKPSTKYMEYLTC